jgi:hypothetical protein
MLTAPESRGEKGLEERREKFEKELLAPPAGGTNIFSRVLNVVSKCRWLGVESLTLALFLLKKTKKLGVWLGLSTNDVTYMFTGYNSSLACNRMLCLGCMY